MDRLRLLEPCVASAFYGQFKSPRPAQLAAIEPLCLGRNIVLCSATGTGKTEAAVAPIISRILCSCHESDGVRLLYLAPTKALVNDLEKRLQLPVRRAGMTIGIRHGDRDDLTHSRAPDILITTPESLDVLIHRNEKSLASVQAIIIDEVHLLYNTQRGLQTAILIRRLKRMARGPVQWAALSATVGAPVAVRDFLFGPNEPADFLVFGTSRPIDAHICHVPDDGTFLSLVRRLMEGRDTKLLVFANSRRECERLASVLGQDERLKQCTYAHYSSLSPEVRAETETRFCSSRTAICVATSTLELGIDIGDIDVVLLWDVVGSVESFLQRIGRGNRRASKTNVVCCITGESESVLGDTLRFSALIDAGRKGEMTRQKPFELYGAIAQQCISIIDANGGRYLRIADLLSMTAFRDYITRPIIESILAEITSHGYIQRHGFLNSYGADQRLYDLVDLRMVFGNHGIRSSTVGILHRTKSLGEIPSVNLLRLKPGRLVQFAGQRWEVRKVTADGIFVEPSNRQGQTVDLVYSGPGVGCEPFVIDRMRSMAQNEEIPNECLSRSLKDLVARSADLLSAVSSAGEIPFQRKDGKYSYLTFAGELVNRAIALITGQVDWTSDDLYLTTCSPIDWSSLPRSPQAFERVFSMLFRPTQQQSLYQLMLPKDLQIAELSQVWLHDETIARILERLAASRSVEFDWDLARILR